MSPLPPDEIDGEDRDDDLIEEGEDLLGFTEEHDQIEPAEPEEGDEGFTDETDVYAHELAEQDEPPPPATWAGQQKQDPEPPSEELEPPSEELEPPSEELEPPSEELEPPSEELDEPVAEESEAEPQPEPELEPEPEPEPAAAAPSPSETAPMPAVPITGEVGQPQGLTPAEGGIPPGMVSHPGLGDLDDDTKPPKAGLWARFLAAALVIVLSMAAATSISSILFLTEFAEGLQPIEGLPSLPESDDQQTILVLGSDKRVGEGIGPGLSDTTMLIRLDAVNDHISLMSLPRDLQVNIPGYGVDKLNAAYSYGGPPLTLQTVQELTGLEINHVVNVDFEGFAKAVDAIDCVYIDVDRDYYHVNDPYSVDQYAEIDIDPGYQRLCGPDALAYVRYRHEDNDIVRGARQQDFLREARAKVSPTDVWTDKNQYLDIFTDYTSSDIHEAGPLIQLLKLFIGLRDAGVQKVEFHGDIGSATSTYVTTSNTQLRIAIAKFLGEDSAAEEASGGDDSIPAQGPDDEGDNGGGDGGGDPGDTGDGGGGGGSSAMIDTSDSAQSFGSQFAKEVNFPVYAPTQLPEGSVYDDDSLAYGVDAPDGENFGGYKLVFSRFGPYGVDEYFGVMGTKWSDPPILENPSETREIDGREYLLFYDGGRLRTVAIKPDGDDGPSYWVSNSLTQSLDENEMLGIATSLTEIQKSK